MVFPESVWDGCERLYTAGSPRATAGTAGNGDRSLAHDFRCAGQFFCGCVCVCVCVCMNLCCYVSVSVYMSVYTWFNLKACIYIVCTHIVIRTLLAQMSGSQIHVMPVQVLVENGTSAGFSLINEARDHLLQVKASIVCLLPLGIHHLSSVFNFYSHLLVNYMKPRQGGVYVGILSRVWWGVCTNLCQDGGLCTKVWQGGVGCLYKAMAGWGGVFVQSHGWVVGVVVQSHGWVGWGVCTKPWQGGVGCLCKAMTGWGGVFV